MGVCCCKGALFKPYVRYSPTSAKFTYAQWIKEKNKDPIFAEFAIYKEGKLYQYKRYVKDSRQLHTMMCCKQQFVMRNILQCEKIKSSQRDTHPFNLYFLRSKENRSSRAAMMMLAIRE